MQKVAGSSGRHVSFPLVQSIYKIGVITTSSLKFEFISGYFNQHVEIDSIEVKLEKRTKGDDSKAVFVSDLNFWGIPPKPLIQSFVDTPFDILINFAEPANEVANYICALSLAKFKVSKLQHHTIYDLIINQIDIDDKDYVNEIIKTLNNFSN